MSRLGFVLLGPALVLIVACGGQPPEKEMQQAEGAIEAARAAGAPEYAADEFGAAVKALERARRAAVDRDYRQSLNDALDARDRAKTSARQAADNMAAARVDADRSVAAAAASLEAVRKRLKDLDARRAGRGPASTRRSLDACAERVQEARTALNKRQYAVAAQTANAASKAIIEIGAELDARVAPAPRRGC
ncbi:MAG: DUF4398 domain-containing protein [Acidimicrobiia bacterium]|nr:DUF4398 domain-containing protein [Acidimicrobiia bacterium]